MSPFEIIEPTAEKVPIILSSPHSGTELPDEVIDDYRPEQLDSLDDTDWFIPELYSFASEMGITVIKARYSRWLIDLNRDPKGEPLYNDGRHITGLCPHDNFMGEAIYKNGRQPSEEEIKRRLDLYYWPYYRKIQELLDSFKGIHERVLLYDAHSIRALVPTIRNQRFPDLVMGTAEGASSDIDLVEAMRDGLTQSNYSFEENDPFKGGHITRYFGQPAFGQNAIQLERCKDLYMNDAQHEFDQARADNLREVLKANLEELIKRLL